MTSLGETYEKFMKFLRPHSVSKLNNSKSQQKQQVKSTLRIT